MFTHAYKKFNLNLLFYIINYSRKIKKKKKKKNEHQ